MDDQAPQPPCRVSCRLEVLPGDRMADQIAKAKDFGFDAISLPGRSLEAILPQWRAWRSTGSLPVVSISLGFEGSLVSPDPEARETCRNSLIELFQVGAELEAKTINMPPFLTQDNPGGLAGHARDGTAKTARDNLLAAQLPALGDQAEKYGLLLLLEPVNRFESSYLNQLGHAADLCERIRHPAVGCTADFFHMQIEELSVPNAIRDAGPWLRHVHVAENTRVEPGPGSLDFAPGLRMLKEIGYSGYLEVECRSLSGPAEKVLPHSVRYLHAAWAAS